MNITLAILIYLLVGIAINIGIIAYDGVFRSHDIPILIAIEFIWPCVIIVLVSIILLLFILSPFRRIKNYMVEDRIIWQRKKK